MDRTLFILAVAAALIVSFGFAGPAIATHAAGNGPDNPWTASGSIVTTVPAAQPTEPCDENSGPETGNGVWGEVYALPDPGEDGTGDGDHFFSFEVTDLAGADLEWFNDAGGQCEALGANPGGETTLCCHTLGTRVDENSLTWLSEVPLGATHVVVNFGGGFGSGPGTYTLTIPVESPGTCDQSPFC